MMEGGRESVIVACPGPVSEPHASWTPVMDMQQFLNNRLAFPPEELARFAGKYVAWSPDGMRILASDENELRLDATLKHAGYDTSEILVAYVPDPDEVILGHAGFLEYFDAEFRGADRTVILTPNRRFPGSRT
jgi:hypothetical protein